MYYYIRINFQHALMCSLGIVALITVLYILQQEPHKSTYNVPSFAATYISKHKTTALHIAVVACGHRLQETLVMIKSAILFNHYQEYIKFLIFTEYGLTDSFKEKLADWRELLPHLFDFELLPLKFPKQSVSEWRNLFKPCASQRLFLPLLLTKIDSLLYVDTDILFLSPVTDVWGFFRKFNDSQMAALTPEHENENIGWYNRFARHPYYGRMGVNSGVMLMNLTRMREFNWEEHIIPIYKEYRQRITWGDQDIINILFYYHPDKLHIMPCEYNYRPDHCMYMSICNSSSSGIKLIHGNRGYFHSHKQPLFKAVYEAIESFQLGTNAFSNFLLPLQSALLEESVNNSSCGKMSRDALMQANSLFVDEFNFMSVEK